MRISKFVKSIIVLVGFIGMFLSYSYFRLIYPYSEVGGTVVKVSEKIFFRQIAYIDGLQYSYWTNGVVNPQKILVMLPPSSSTGDYFGRYAQVFPKNTLIIAPDYPGRGLTDPVSEFDTIPRLTNRVAVLLKYLFGEKKFDVIGPSFGGMIATELSRDKDLKIEKVFLVATGEFFAPDQKYMYHFLFYPATVSESIRNKYVNWLLARNYFGNLKNTSIVDLLEQGLSTIDYKIDTNYQTDTPLEIVIFNKDNVVQPGSKAKLEQVFNNYKEYYFDLTHSTDSFFDPRLMFLIKNNI
jgi:pimeloyl-ACP methyl ester carboxylesterase